MKPTSFIKQALLTSLVVTSSLLIIPATTMAQTIQTYMPEEGARHEGTWLQWPHHYTYGVAFRERLDKTWIDMTRALVTSENVHIIAYNTREKRRIQNLLKRAKVSLSKVDFTIRKTDDFWVRDNGPVFVYDNQYNLNITDWGFNGWGYDTPYRKDDTVPRAISNRLDMKRIDLNDVILEGGSVEVDGNGTLMATRSSVLENGRNPDISEAEMESILTRYLGVSNFIWLDGAAGGKEDITDTHIDGFARFGNEGTLVTMRDADLRYWGLSERDIRQLKRAKDTMGNYYDVLKLPLTKRNVRTAYGENLGYKGSYVNYYIANTVVLIPKYNDPNDVVARRALQRLYPNRKVVSIDVRNLYKNGGMIHCITQQQPAAY